MSNRVKRVRMMAGPNGSGKSTIKDSIDPSYLIYYVNADLIEEEISASGSLNLKAYGVQSSTKVIQEFMCDSSLIRRGGLLDQVGKISVDNDSVELSSIKVGGYWAAIFAEFIREKLLEKGESFTFETVMSHISKVQFLQRAQDLGYRTYLYFVATSSPEINVERVKLRVSQNGHDVPEDKIRKRYVESLDLLSEAIKVSNRAYIFDNSKEEGQHFLVAEFQDGVLIESAEEVPGWFDKAVIQKAKKE